MEKINLFCLPFAGGNKYSYRAYEEKSPAFLKILPLEYPGRGSRINEPLTTDISFLVEDLYSQMKGLIDQREYAIYGHSMGGLLACLLTRRLLDKERRPPLHIFVSGTTGPASSGRDEKKRHLLGKQDFFAELKSLNGSPAEILDNEELLDYFEPILRADFEASETYIYEELPPLPIPFTVITGTEEDMEMDDIRTWQKESEFKIDFIRMPGNHFFIYQYPAKIIEIIAKKVFLHLRTT
jgi:surfactin synthase thioesterase subunit